MCPNLTKDQVSNCIVLTSSHTIEGEDNKEKVERVSHLLGGKNKDGEPRIPRQPTQVWNENASMIALIPTNSPAPPPPPRKCKLQPHLAHSPSNHSRNCKYIKICTLRLNSCIVECGGNTESFPIVFLSFHQFQVMEQISLNMRKCPVSFFYSSLRHSFSTPFQKEYLLFLYAYINSSLL